MPIALSAAQAMSGQRPAPDRARAAASPPVRKSTPCSTKSPFITACSGEHTARPAKTTPQAGTPRSLM
jgi:hypothetical protein